MKRHLDFEVPGDPVPKDRPRVTRWGTYTTKKTKRYQLAVGLAAKAAMAGSEPLDFPVEMVAYFIFEPPASWSNRKREAAIGRELAYTAKPDLDNLGKSVMDAMNGIVFKDDSQVYHLAVCKAYGSTPKTLIRIIKRPDLAYIPRGQERTGEIAEYVSAED